MPSPGIGRCPGEVAVSKRKYTVDDHLMARTGELALRGACKIIKMGKDWMTISIFIAVETSLVRKFINADFEVLAPLLLKGKSSNDYIPCC